MKHITLLAVFLTAAVGAGYTAYPDEVTQYAALAAHALSRVWDNIEANPAPVLIALGTFLLTVIYYKAKGKSLRESLAVAATRVTVVTAPHEAAAEENPVIRRAKARATRAQLLADQIGLENKHRRLPEQILKAEKESCYTEQAVAEAEEALADKEKSLADKRQAHEEAAARLEMLRLEKATADAELAAIDAELKKLAELV